LPRLKLQPSYIELHYTRNTTVYMKQYAVQQWPHYC